MPEAMIAIIDDEALVRSATASLLRSLGYDAVTFAGAEEFLDCSDIHFDCLVSDVQMPGMTGIDLHRRLREDGRRLPVVLMTAYPTPTIDAYAARSGVVAVLEKPLGSACLIAAVHKALNDDLPH